MRALVFSDLHLGTEDQLALDVAADFTAVFAPDVVLVAGDVSTSGRRREMEAAALWLGRLDRPIVATPGNHDVPYWNLFSRIADPFRRFDRALGSARRPTGERVMVRTPETARGLQARLDWSLGRASREDVAEAAADVAAATPETLRVILAHHPLHPPPTADVRARTRGGPEAAKALALAGADLIISGHLHVPFVASVPAGDGMTYALGGGTLSTRTREVPASFLALVSDGPGRITVEARACTGAGAPVLSATTLALRPPRLAVV